MDIMEQIVHPLVIKVVGDVGEEITLNVIYVKVMLMLVQVIYVCVIWDIIWMQHIIVINVITPVEIVLVVVHFAQIVNLCIEH